MAFRHLARGAAAGRADDAGLWEAVVGPAAAALEAALATAEDGEVTAMPAVVFADQSTAFARVGFDWIRRVLACWNRPAWLQRAVVNLTVGRLTRAASPAGLGPSRALMRGLGMGGTVSPLIWAMAYDPIIVGAARAVGAPPPIRILFFM